MKKILEDLYFGEIQPGIADYDNPQLKKATQIMGENEEILIKILDGEEKRLFQDLMNAQSEMTANYAVENFIYGFKLGARIMMEVMSE